MSNRVSSALGYEVVDDFLASVVAGWLNWLAVASGAGAGTAIPAGASAPDHWGIRQLNTGTTAAGRVAIHMPAGAGAGGIQLGTAQLQIAGIISYTDLSVLAERYSSFFGLGNNFAAGTSTEGVFFRYDEAVSANWQAVCVTGGVETAVVTGVPVVAMPNWVLLEIWIDRGQPVQFFINRVLVATIATNIPLSVDLAVGLRILKSLGTTSRDTLIDAFVMRVLFTTPRVP